MGISTLAVATAVTPAVTETWFSHYLNRKPRKQKPTAHISYDVGLNTMRQFLTFAAKQTIEDVQDFTAQIAPNSPWVRTQDQPIPVEHLERSAELLQNELGPHGLHAIGGRTWWKWRQDDSPLHAEWIEMRKHHDDRVKRSVKCQRSMLYVHGGAYYFASVDSHRYQIQRHARKLQARVLAPRYRLAPQFPFPCGLMDCLASYLFLLTQQPPETIILAGDSAGGGMVLSMLVLLRDQDLPMPAGAILLSPWVDLTHSFPSVAGPGNMDYVPASGFHHKPSMSWPPPNADELASLDEVMVEMEHGKQMSARALREQARERSETGKGKGRASVSDGQADVSQTPKTFRNIRCNIDGKVVDLKDQIQFYAPNELLAHPLVSPVMQASLGGLPPLCVLTGGGEMLRDEQIYLAHKAANPSAYPPPALEDYAQGETPHPSLLDRASINTAIARYPPTYVQLQIWDDLCHVATTLSWTRPAKYMYRSVAQFGAWALARAQMSEIRILDDDEVSIISTESSDSLDSDDPASDDKSTAKSRRKSQKEGDEPAKTDKRVQSGLHRPTTPVTVGRAGDPLPLFKDHMIRQRVTRHGDVYALDPPSMLEATTMATPDIGVVKQGPVKKWLAAHNAIMSKNGDLQRDMQYKRLQEMTETTGGRGMVFTAGREDSMLIGEEHPPPTALAGRTTKQLKAMGLLTKHKPKASKSFAMWSGWGSKHDEDAMENEDRKVKQKADVTMSVVNVRRRQSMNLLGTGPISGGGPLEAGQQAEASGPSTLAKASTAQETVPASQAEIGQSSAAPSSPQGKSVAAPVAPTASPGSPSSARSAGSQPERVVSASDFPIIKANGASAPATVPFKLARPGNINTAQASTLTLDEADGAITGSAFPNSAIPDSATLPPANYPHHSIASTLNPDDIKKAGEEPMPKSDSLYVPAAVTGAAVAGTGAAVARHSAHGSTTSFSRPSTADMSASRPISPGGESTHESIAEAQVAQAQPMRISHARASSMGGIDAVEKQKLANADDEVPPVPNGNGASATRPGMDREVTPKAPQQMPAGTDTVPVPAVGALHGAETSTGGELSSAEADSSDWASGVMRDVEDAGSRTVSRDGKQMETPMETPTERPGVERFVTADQL